MTCEEGMAGLRFGVDGAWMGMGGVSGLGVGNGQMGEVVAGLLSLVGGVVACGWWI